MEESGTYDHDRKLPGKGKYNDKGKGNDAALTLQRDYRFTYRGVNHADWGEGWTDNEIDYNGDWGIFGYQGGHPLSQVNLAENENSYSLIEIEFGDIGYSEYDIEVEY